MSRAQLEAEVTDDLIDVHHLIERRSIRNGSSPERNDPARLTKGALEAISHIHQFSPGCIGIVNVSFECLRMSLTSRSYDIDNGVTVNTMTRLCAA
jgi:hypothetical protein